MKNITHSTSACFLALVSSVLLFEAGCSSTNMPGSNTAPSSQMVSGDILSHYDMSNLTGIMFPRKESYSIVTHVIPAKLQTNWDGTQSWGQANFNDANGNPLDIGVVIFNHQLVNHRSRRGHREITTTTVFRFTPMV